MEYIISVSDLAAKATEKLGSMNEGTYEVFFREAEEVAKKYGVIRPILGIDIKFKSGAHESLSELAYPISAEQWDQFLVDAHSMCEYIPDVYLVDGNKYALSI